MNFYERRSYVLSSEPYEKWVSSLKEILDNLSIFGAEAVEDEQYEVLIAKTIQRLPKDVGEKVLKEVNFIVAGGVDGTGFSMNILNAVIGEDPSVKPSTTRKAYLKVPLILLNFANMRERSEEEMMSTIAHEIAHFILGHFDDIHKSSKDKEKEADDLIEKWGFKRAYAYHGS
jgi:hypothetical protein